MDELFAFLGMLFVIAVLALALMTSLAGAGRVFTRSQGAWVMGIAAVIFGVLMVATVASAAEAARDPAQVRAFRRANPCPATGKARGACPGWVVDHVIPLCGGGADRPENMQWQRVSAAAAKDKREVRYCACLRAHRPACSFTP